MSDKRKADPFAHLSTVQQQNQLRESQNFFSDEEDDGEEEENVSDSLESETETRHNHSHEERPLARSFERLKCDEGSLVAMGPTNPKGPTMHYNPDTDNLKTVKSLNKIGKPCSQNTNDRILLKLKRQTSGPMSSPSPGSDSGYSYTGSQTAIHSRMSSSPFQSPEYSGSRCDWCEYKDRANRDTTLVKFVRNGDTDGLLNYLQENTNSVRLPIEINTPNASFLTPLAIAVYHQNFEALSQLVTFGADPGKTGIMGNNCFHLAADSDDYGLCLSKLLEVSSKKFNPQQFSEMINARNIFNASPLDILQIRLRSQNNLTHRDTIDRMIGLMRNYQTNINQRNILVEHLDSIMNVI